MGTLTLSKFDRVKALGDALRERRAGETLPVPVLRRIVAEALDVTSRQSYYNHTETLHEVLGILSPVEGVGFRVMEEDEVCRCPECRAF